MTHRSSKNAGDRTPSSETVAARLVLGTARDSVLYTLDRTGRVTAWNEGAECMMGYGAHEVVGRHFSLFYTPEDEAAADPTGHLLAAVDGRVEHQTWRMRKNRTRFRANVALTPVRDLSGRLTGFVEVVRDLTEQG